MTISRERAADLSRRIVERLRKTPGVELAAEPEFVRSRLLQAFLEFEREADSIGEAVRARLLARPRHPMEGSREWDLLFSEEVARAFSALVSRGE